MGCKRRKKLDGGCGSPPTFVSLTRKEERELQEEKPKSDDDDDDVNDGLVMDLSRNDEGLARYMWGREGRERKKREREAWVKNGGERTRSLL